ncbi:hypothetical protein OESDEN_07795, partial [Oesophagostomum dentatum]
MSKILLVRRIVHFQNLFSAFRGVQATPPSERPRLPDTRKTETTHPAWRIEIPLPDGAQAPTQSPPPTPPSSQSSPVPHHATKLISLTPGSALILPPSGPPPPPPGLLSPAPTPPPSEVKQRVSEVYPVTNERRSFLEEIQNLDKGKLRHVNVDSVSPNLPSIDSMPGDGGLLSAIQAELDKRREYFAIDSDN